MKILLTITALVLHPALSAGGSVWTYTGQYGPEYWKTINGSDCNGTHQSPINIVTSNLVNRNLGSFQLDGYDSENPYLGMFNSGHGVTVTLGPSFIYNLSGGGLPEDYTATQFHFHWGANNSRGSEHLIDGEAYPAELHIVHFHVDHDGLVPALTSRSHDAVAALGFFIEIGPDTNTAFESFLAYIGNVSHDGDSLGEGNLPSFSLRSIMPFDLSRFYRYNGSLTIPNCYETVIWTVFEETIKISQAQLDQFRSISGDETDGQGNALPTVDNFRTTNPIYDRVVYYSAPEQFVDSTPASFTTTPVSGTATVRPTRTAFFICALFLTLNVL